MLVLPEYLRRQVFQLSFANHHKIPQDFKILTFDLKTAPSCKIKKLVS
jgi:hypothetical protein